MRTEITPYRKDPTFSKVAFYDAPQAERNAARETLRNHLEIATYDDLNGALLIQSRRKDAVLKLFRKS